MKIDRRIREYKEVIENLCSEFNLTPPNRVELMKNYIGKPQRSWGKTVYSHSSDSYKIKIRKFRLEGEKRVLRSEQNILKSICHELAHSKHFEHNPQHFALTNEMVNYLQ